MATIAGMYYSSDGDTVVLLSVFGSGVLDEFRQDIAGTRRIDGQNKIIGCNMFP